MTPRVINDVSCHSRRSIPLKPNPKNEALKADVRGPLSYEVIVGMRVELRGLKMRLREINGKIFELDEALKEFEKRFENQSGK